MSETGTTSWWPQFGGKAPNPESADVPTPPVDLPNQSTIVSKSTTKSYGLWNWGNAEQTPDLQTNEVNGTTQLASTVPKQDEQSWWWYKSLTTIVPDPKNAIDAKNETSSSSEPTGYFGSWLLWNVFLSGQIVDPESDMEDQQSAELYREAKQVLENSRDSCHYAISGFYGSSDVELAVTGTKTATHPVKYNHKKKPAIPSELFERSMTTPRPSRANSPHPVGDQKPDHSVRGNNFGSNGTRKALDSSLQMQQMGFNLNNQESISSNSSIRSVHVNTDLSNPSAVLPDLADNFREITMTTKIRLIGESVLYGPDSSEKHLYSSTKRSIALKKKKIGKKAVVISLHSFLPTKFVKLIIGQSTGNALKFADYTLQAISSWLDEHESQVGSIQHISLEGFGTISSRSNNSFDLLQNWSEQINSAELVFFVANSAAVPALVLLALKMFQSEIFDLSDKKIGLLSMAGAILGPCIGLDTKVVIRAYTQSENEIINELFDLQKINSNLSLSIKDAFHCLCSNNTKITLAGSISDQFIPLYSSLGQELQHPNIFRCIFVNENCEVPPFIVKLILIILIMENVGHGDHNLISILLELTQAASQLPGSHGKIYSNSSIYEAGVKFALETTSVRQQRETKTVDTPNTSDSERSLYHLPWCVRGLLNDLMHIKHINNLGLLGELQRHYLKWEPTTKHWRTVKHCFAAFEDLTVEDILL
ncbi:hypothetical protein PUMCH_003272 [Australozyma saopauloensis]|uniref:YMC020W-like alpha/beta hydrolase domain-containing protein n=1 Tax=Australozyma saopauloensis TaxID=291208 RepID=A0AAX4HBJ8_9ASCO|nr:hypothetical protein PUMCH_003272 [[Candida] saopauloensis]